MTAAATDPAGSGPRLEVRETGWDDPAGVALREAMEAEMRMRYADRVAEVLARSGTAREADDALGVEEEDVVYVAVAYDADLPVGHAALRRRKDGDLELKRMYVTPTHRGTGVATTLLTAVEDAARARGADRILLQTGDRQPDAVRLYERQGYTRVPIFPPYEWLDFSICMEKRL